MRVVALVLIVLLLVGSGFSYPPKSNPVFKQQLLAIYQGQPIKARQALMIYNWPRYRARFPNDRLRAAIASLLSTKAGEMAVPYILHDMTQIRIKKSLMSSTSPTKMIIAEMHHQTGNMYLNTYYADGPIEFEGAVILHEMVHRYSRRHGGCEEYVAERLDAQSALESVIAHPELFKDLSDHITEAIYRELVVLYNEDLGDDYKKCTADTDEIAPPIVKACVENIVGHPVELSTFKDYADYMFVNLKLDEETKKLLVNRFNTPQAP